MSQRIQTRPLIGPGEAWAVVTALSYTSVNVLLRATAVEIDPWVGSLLRQVPVAVLAWMVVAMTDRAMLSPRDERFLGWRLVVALISGGFVAFVIGNVFFFGALASGGLGVTAAGAQGGVVLAGAIGGAVLLAERLPRFGGVGIAVLVAGLAAIAVAQGTPSAAWLIGLGLALAAGTTYAISNLITRIVQRRRQALFVTLAANSLGGSGALILIQLVRGGGDPLMGTAGTTVLVVLAAGCFNALALVGIAQSLRHLTVALANSIYSATVVFSFVASVAIFGESASPLMIIGVAAVAAGIVVAQIKPRVPSDQPERAVTPR